MNSPVSAAPWAARLIPRRILVEDLDRLGVAGSASGDLLVSRGPKSSACGAERSGDNTGDLVKVRFHAPEAPCGKRRPVGRGAYLKAGMSRFMPMW